MQLLKRGIRRTWMKGPRPLDPHPLHPTGPRLVGEAFTLRFVPLREDLSTLESYSNPISIRQGIEQVTPGQVVVIDACGELGCGTLGDILMARLQARGCIGVVTDGALRDLAGIREVGLPAFCAGAAAPPSVGGLAFAGWQQTIGCGGVAVVPGDIVVADEDGAVILPRALADEVAPDALEQERYETFAQERVRAGAPVIGLYPATEASLAEYEAWRRQQEEES